MLYLLILFTIINLSYWVFLFRKLTTFKVVKASETNPNLTLKPAVILAVRNEARGIRAKILKILEQDYPNFDVWILDDNSQDASSEIIKELQVSYPNLHYKKNKEHLGKKRTLHYAIPAIPNEYLVFTDGDCEPASNDWLRSICSSFSKKKEIILGYGPNYKTKGFLNLFERYETFITALQYFSYSIAGIPYMGVGRNLAYKKNLFEEASGFSNHLDILSGDDDLFIRQVANKENVAINVQSGAFMFSSAPSSWRAFIRQKRRHVSTSEEYKFYHKILLALYAFSHIASYLLLVFVSPLHALLVWFLRISIILLSNYRSFHKLGEKDLLIYFPLLDLSLFLYYSFMSIFTFFPSKNKW